MPSSLRSAGALHRARGSILPLTRKSGLSILTRLVAHMAFPGNDVPDGAGVELRTRDFDFADFKAAAVNVQPAIHGGHVAEGAVQHHVAGAGIDQDDPSLL